MGDSTHRIHVADATDMGFLGDESVALVVTSPPYPMIEMWDDLFRQRTPGVDEALRAGDGPRAFELMHKDLDRVWAEVFRLLRDGGFACINIGDATRTLGERFRLYSNHARILSECFRLGFDVLPPVLWRKQTNAPNKFMGSGMLPAGAYVTLEHEYILVLRKGAKRTFQSAEDKRNRQESAFFWEERNTWFSDVWDFKGTRQALGTSGVRGRSAAFPFELAYRLICMYSARSDTVLDPFLGTGTTMFAAMAAGRHSVGVEVDGAFLPVIHEGLGAFSEEVNTYLGDRLRRHLEFCGRREQRSLGKLKYTNANHQMPVMTGQETRLRLEALETISAAGDQSFTVTYTTIDKSGTAPRLRGLRTHGQREQLALAF